MNVKAMQLMSDFERSNTHTHTYIVKNGILYILRSKFELNFEFAIMFLPCMSLLCFRFLRHMYIYIFLSNVLYIKKEHKAPLNTQRVYKG
jgi:hypothetical protein